MKNVKLVIAIIVLVVILFSIFKYATDETIIENMSQWRFMIIASIVNNESEATSDLEKVRMLNKLDVLDPKIKDVLESNDSNPEKIKRIKNVIKKITL